MELHSVRKTLHHSHLGDEKHEMLSLNRRLETYLNRVKLLEEENMLLAKEIQSLTHNKHRALTRRKGLEEELQQARLEVDAAWRDRVHTELEVGRLTDELQALDLQRQREAQAYLKTKTTLEQSRKELEEEKTAQIWLREKVSQLEHEMRLLIQTHQEDVAQLEVTLTHSKSTVLPTLAQRGNQTPNLLQLGQEYSQRAAQAWQEAAEAYQDQLARLEESLNQARSRLTQVTQEKSESQLKLQTLQKEITSVQEIRLHLERTTVQQGARHSQEIQKLQEHMEGLEVEKEELGQQINRILQENRGLMQLQMSLGLEVATYRALLDSESLRDRNISFLNQPRNISNTDAVFCPWGMKRNYQTQLSANHQITSLSSARGVTRAGPAVITAKSVCAREPTTFSETPKSSKKTADATQSPSWETPYPNILQDGAVENFRPQEVNEKVTHAEPLSPPNEQEAFALMSGGKEDEENCDSVDIETCEESPVVSYQVESGFSSEPLFNDDNSHHLFTTSNVTPEFFKITEKPCGLSDASAQDVSFEEPAEKQEPQEQSQAPADAWVKEDSVSEEVKHMQGETSDSETEAVLEPTFGSRTSSPASECEPEESVFNQPTDVSPDEKIPNDDTVEKRQEISSSQVGTNEPGVEDKLYPDGEEMDTWDSVIERKADVQTDDGITKDEDKRQHAEPEEDISAKEPEHEKTEVRQDFATDAQENNAVMDAQQHDVQHETVDQDNALLSDKEDDDSQNVSVSWRTEVESDSYAQENTLADTRPLIQYKSDETDANAHPDESESSEGEQEKKMGEMGMWSEGKSKRFGTMEDLCEEGEGEVLDEEYDLGYSHTEDRGVGHSLTTSEYVAPVKDTENAEEMIKKVDEGHTDEETEDIVEPMALTYAEYDEELETDGLVEQELENLCTDSFSAHFAQRQNREDEEMALLQVTEQDKVGQTQTEAMLSCAEPALRVNYELPPSTAVIDHPCENPNFSDSSVTVPQTESLAEDGVQHKDPKTTDATEIGEADDEHKEETCAGETEDGFNDFISRPETEEINKMQEEDVQEVAAPSEMEEGAPVETSSESQENLTEDVADCESFPDAAEAAEGEILENPSEEIEIRDEVEHGEKSDNVPESDEDDHHDDKGSDEGMMTHKEESSESSPDSVPDGNDIFVVKDSTELLDNSGKDNDLHDVFSSGIKNEFWMSCAETSATYQPDDTCNAAAEQTSQHLGFDDNLVWGNLENTNVFNGNSRVGMESGKASAAEEEQGQTHPEVKQVFHSEESEVEGESWSSEEEPV